jgi:hypothetical protein
MGCYPVKSYVTNLSNISSFKEKVINGDTVKMVEEEINKHVLCSVPSVLNFLKKCVVESGDIRTGLVLVSCFATVGIPRFMTEQYV